MKCLRRELPSLTALVAFEAAARHRNFTHAAEELGVSQAAVSRQIAQLEDNLNVLLFHRGSRPLGLTPEGARLAEAVSGGLGHIAETASDLRRAGSTQTITVAASVAFTSLWLMPRVAGFRQAQPGIALCLLAADPHTDPLHSEVDLAVRFGDGHWSGLEAVKLFDDLVVPVAAPGYFERRAKPQTPADFIHEILLHMNDVDPTWMPWRTWFAQHGLTPPRHDTGALSFNAYPNMIQAARDGQGIALGWVHLIARDLERGDLEHVTEDIRKPREAQYLTWRKRRALSGAAAAFRAWIVAEARDERILPANLPRPG